MKPSESGYFFGLETCTNPALQSIYNGRSLRENYSALNPDDVLYETAIGALLGSIGGVNVMRTVGSAPGSDLSLPGSDFLYHAAVDDLTGGFGSTAIENNYLLPYSDTYSTPASAMSINTTDTMQDWIVEQYIAEIEKAKAADASERAYYRELEHKYLRGNISEEEFEELRNLENIWGQFDAAAKTNGISAKERYRKLEQKFRNGNINEQEWNELIRLEDIRNQSDGASEYARYKELEHKFVDGSINEREWNELIRLEDNWGQFGGLIKSEKNNLCKRIIHQEQAKWKAAYDSTAKYIGMPVTKEAVEKVALLHPKGWDQSTARKLQEESKRVLSSLIGRNLDTEAGRVYNINMEPLTDVEIGKDGDGRICLPRFTSNHITLHTHPDGNIFSGTDIQSFIMNADMCAMVVVGNNGTSYFVQKTFDYDGFEFTRKWMTVQETLNECIATGDLPRYMSEMEKFLEGGWKYGIQFIKK